MILKQTSVTSAQNHEDRIFLLQIACHEEKKRWKLKIRYSKEENEIDDGKIPVKYLYFKKCDTHLAPFRRDFSRYVLGV